MAKFLRASVVLVALASVSPGVRAAGDDDTIKLTVASSQATTLAWVGTMHTLVVPELERRLAIGGLGKLEAFLRQDGAESLPSVLLIIDD